MQNNSKLAKISFLQQIPKFYIKIKSKNIMGFLQKDIKRLIYVYTQINIFTKQQVFKVR